MESPKLVPLRIQGGTYVDVRLPLLLDADIDDLTDGKADASDRMAYAYIAEKEVAALEREIAIIWEQHRASVLDAVARKARRDDDDRIPLTGSAS